jgi:hypothetical protein
MESKSVLVAENNIEMQQYIGKGMMVDESLTLDRALGLILYYEATAVPANQQDIAAMVAISLPQNKTEFSGEDIQKLIGHHTKAAGQNADFSLKNSLANYKTNASS